VEEIALQNQRFPNYQRYGRDGLLPETRVQVRAAFFYKRRPSDGTGGGRHTDVPMMA
jgi:hypothetical protein